MPQYRSAFLIVLGLGAAAMMIAAKASPITISDASEKFDRAALII